MALSVLASLGSALPGPLGGWVDAIDHSAQSLGLPAGAGVATLLLGLLLLFVLLRPTARGGSKGGAGRVDGAKRDSVVFVGTCGVGKTALALKAFEDTDVRTVTSMRVTEMELARAWGVQGKVRVVDFPGHPRLRHDLSKQWPRARCAVLVVDSTISDAALRETAELAAEILTTKSFADAETEIPLLVACNKADAPSARSPEALRIAIEAELDRLKTSRTAVAREGEDDADEDDTIVLGKQGRTFSFAMDAGVPVAFVAVSAKTGAVAPLVDWVAACFGAAPTAGRSS